MFYISKNGLLEKLAYYTEEEQKTDLQWAGHTPKLRPYLLWLEHSPTDFKDCTQKETWQSLMPLLLTLGKTSRLSGFNAFFREFTDPSDQIELMSDLRRTFARGKMGQHQKEALKRTLSDLKFNPEFLNILDIHRPFFKGVLPLERLKNAGFEAWELKNMGYELRELQGAGFEVGALKNAGFGAWDLKNAGFGTWEIIGAIFEVCRIRGNTALFKLKRFCKNHSEGLAAIGFILVSTGSVGLTLIQYGVLSGASVPSLWWLSLGLIALGSILFLFPEGNRRVISNIRDGNIIESVKQSTIFSVGISILIVQLIYFSLIGTFIISAAIFCITSQLLPDTASPTNPLNSKIAFLFFSSIALMAVIFLLNACLRFIYCCFTGEHEISDEEDFLNFLSIPLRPIFTAIFGIPCGALAAMSKIIHWSFDVLKASANTVQKAYSSAPVETGGFIAASACGIGLTLIHYSILSSTAVPALWWLSLGLAVSGVSILSCSAAHQIITRYGFFNSPTDHEDPSFDVPAAGLLATSP